MKIISVLAILVLSTSHAESAPEKPQARVFVHMESSSAIWKTRAIRGTILQFLSGFEQVTLVQNLEIRKFGCDGRDVKCILSGLANQRIDIAILGRFDGQNVSLKSYETWSRSEVAKVAIPIIKDISLTEFKHRVFRLVQPFVEVGGLLDQYYALSKPPAPYKPEENVLSGISTHLGFAGFLMLLFWSPIFIVKRMAKKLKVSLPRRLRHRKFNLAAIFGLPLVWCLGAVYGPKLLMLAESFIPSTRYLIGGVSSATILILFQRFTIPSLRLVEKTTFANLSPILRTWFNAVVIKIAVLGFMLSPLILVILVLDKLIGWNAVTLWMVIVPVLVAACFLWYLFLVAELTIFLDNHLIYGFRRNENQWQKEIKKYFRGYVNRLGIHLNDQVIEKTRFLPTKFDGIFTYGGGFVPRRVLISSLTLAYAMGPLKENESEEDLGFADYQAGTVFPRRRKRSQSDFELEENFFAKIWRRFSSDDQPVELDFRAHAARNFNLHNATILGYVVPANPDIAVPLIANNREDFEVVAELLTEHYSEFDKDQGNSELDDTDPTDKDFLFGGLLREYIVMEQNEHFALTFYHAFNVILPKLPQRFVRVTEKIKMYCRRYFSRFVNQVTDCYAALNFGRHHLVQYLFYSMERKARLTARADTGVLYAVSKQILEEVKSLPSDEEDRWPDNATLKNRLSWIADLFFKVPGAVAERPQPWLGPVALGVLFIVGIGLFLGESIQYRSVYQERMERMKEKIENSKQEQDNGRE